MTRVDLPEGVPPDNQTKAFASKSGPVVPDTSAPAFADLQDSFPKNDRGILSRVVVELEEEEDEDDKDKDDRLVHGPHLPAPTLILIAIGLVLAAIAAYVISQNQTPAPLCATQPEWNQYDCRAG